MQRIGEFQYVEDIEESKRSCHFGCFKNAEARILDYRRTGKKEARL